MIKHMIMWQLKDELSAEEKADVKRRFKDELEALNGMIPGLVELKVQIDCLDSSNADVMLDSTVEDAEALAVYAAFPEHVAVANNTVRPNIKTRVCMDFEV